jgi:hypothetical protein
MTEAEKKLVDLVAEQYRHGAECGGFSMGSSAMDIALRAVLLERLPPEYEQTLKAAAYRAWDALETMDKIRSQHAMGYEFTRNLRQEWKRERGITE